ncbi:hypothetical protein L1049_010893 [Liquidambar formosana]|uniref:EGF-like domain-containing protein n=1 Tax=Liquidambar formosana TaxID=63359 RepID=A0AAP0RRF2_LIQFO
MESHGLILMQLALLIGLKLAATTTPPEAAQSKPGCQTSCGSVNIPYPFGKIDGPDDCYITRNFQITCNTTGFDSPRAFLQNGNIQVLDISLEGELRIMLPVSFDCYSYNGTEIERDPLRYWLRLPKFPISDTKNKFTAVGCDTSAVIRGVRGGNYTTGCLSVCNNMDNMRNGTCSGVGCCQVPLPKGVRDYNISVSSYDYHSSVMNFNPCSYAFVAEEGNYSFSTLDLADLQKRTEFPVVLDWTIGSETCDDAKLNPSSYACKYNMSVCYEPENGPGYRCKCPEGYEGNPYLPDGCTDIDECETLNPCIGTCHNSLGSFECKCQKGYVGDGKRNGTGVTGCTHINNQFSRIIKIALGKYTGR